MCMREPPITVEISYSVFRLVCAYIACHRSYFKELAADQQSELIKPLLESIFGPLCGNDTIIERFKKLEKLEGERINLEEQYNNFKNSEWGGDDDLEFHENLELQNFYRNKIQKFESDLKDLDSEIEKLATELSKSRALYYYFIKGDYLLAARNPSSKALRSVCTHNSIFWESLLNCLFQNTKDYQHSSASIDEFYIQMLADLENEEINQLRAFFKMQSRDEQIAQLDFYADQLPYEKARRSLLSGLVEYQRQLDKNCVKAEKGHAQDFWLRAKQKADGLKEILVRKAPPKNCVEEFLKAYQGVELNKQGSSKLISHENDRFLKPLKAIIDAIKYWFENRSYQNAKKKLNSAISKNQSCIFASRDAISAINNVIKYYLKIVENEICFGQINQLFANLKASIDESRSDLDKKQKIRLFIKENRDFFASEQLYGKKFLARVDVILNGAEKEAPKKVRYNFTV